MTTDERKRLRRKALWRVADFAAYCEISHWQAKAALARYNVELGGMLLRPSRGRNRTFTFFWAALAKHAPEAFLDDPIEQQRRLDEVEDRVGELHQSQRVIAVQTGANTREIDRLKRRPSRAA